MSYTKLNKEIERYYKSKNIPFYYDATIATQEEIIEGQKRYLEVKDIIVEKWLGEQKYKELISCAHAGWFSYDDFTKPLAEYFSHNNLVMELKFLCEKNIRTKIENLISLSKIMFEDHSGVTIEKVKSFDLETYMTDRIQYNSIV